MKPILITNAHLIAGPKKAIGDGYLHLENGRVKALGQVKNAPRAKSVQIIDAHGRVVMPAFINPHMHLYSQFARGMSVPRMSSFREILEKLWWELDLALTEEDIYYSALLGLIESIKSGVTTVFDHHASYGFIRGSLFTIAEAFLKTGVRGSLCFEVSDRHGDKARDESIGENASFLESCQKHVKKNAQYPLRGMVGLHASMTLSDHTLAESRREMDNYNVGAHIHVAEGMEDVRDAKRKYKESVVRRLYNEGILREGTVAAHCVHVGGRDLDILKKSRAYVVHNPQSNLGNAVGVAPFIKMCGKRIPVGIGTDGMSASVTGDVKLASVLHRIVARKAGVGFAETEKAAMETNPQIASKTFGMKIGALQKGTVADVIISDYIPQTPLTNKNIWAHILFGVMNMPVRTTICGGRVLMRDFEIKVMDEEKITADARILSKKLWSRL